MASQIIGSMKQSGLRITPARKQIIERLVSSDFPLSAADLLREVKVNKSTIYREIDSLLKYRIIISVGFCDGVKRYELLRLEHHHHLICMKCKSVTNVGIAENFSQEEKRIANEKKFTILNHNLEFFGFCKRCNI